MATIEQSIEVNAPLRAVYNQWTQFEEFPRFMEGVKEVHQLDDKRLHWRAVIGGKEKEWDAEIVEQRPDERIAWTSRGGAWNAGAVTFHRIDDNRTRVMLQVDYDPQGERRRRARHREGPRQGRPRALPGVHRAARPRDGRLARRDPARRGQGAQGLLTR